MKQTRGAIRVLDDRDTPAVLELLARDAVSNCFVTSRVEQSGCDPWRLGAQIWGHPTDGVLRSICYAGANLVPVDADDLVLDLYAERAKRQGRRASSIVGEAAQVLGLWERLEPAWGAAREVRAHQPLMAIDERSTIEADPAVRRVRPEEIETIMPACVAMFTEEVGVSPLADGGVLYRARVQELVSAGRSFARIDNGEVMFKAEVGAVTRDTCQVQGVWVNPSLRGRGLSESGMAAVVDICLRELAPTVSLYVNDFNVAARKSYQSVGFRDVGEFASVLF